MKLIEKLPNVLRWVLAMPIALLFSYCARYITLISIQLFLGYKIVGTEIFALSTESILGTAIFLFTIYMLVPKYKVQACLFTAIGYGIFLSFNYGFLFIGYAKERLILDMPLWKYIYSFIAAIITIIYSCFTIYKKEKYEQG